MLNLELETLTNHRADLERRAKDLRIAIPLLGINNKNQRGPVASMEARRSLKATEAKIAEITRQLANAVIEPEKR